MAHLGETAQWYRRETDIGQRGVQYYSIDKRGQRTQAYRRWSKVRHVGENQQRANRTYTGATTRCRTSRCL